MVYFECAECNDLISLKAVLCLCDVNNYSKLEQATLAQH